MLHRSRFGRALAAVASLAVAAVAAPPVAHAQDSPPPPNQAPSLPGVASLPDAAKKLGDGTINAESFKHLDMSDVDGLNLPPAFTREGPAETPAQESSTNPTCAPLVLVAVPGTFEIHRGHDPNKPIGLLGKIAQPLRETGQFSETYINYDSDAGINGVSYANSVSRGTEKTLATIEDVANRCEGSRVLLAGYSQGADIAGDAATAIGQGQTAIPKEAVAGVVLFADPQRAENTNVLSGSSSDLPNLPGELGDAVDKMLKDPSIAQTQMTVNKASGLAQQLLGGDKDKDKGDAGEAGADSSTGASTTSQSSSPSTTKSTGVKSSSSTTSTTPEQAGQQTRPSDTPTAAPAKVNGDFIGPVATVLAADADLVAAPENLKMSENPVDIAYALRLFGDMPLEEVKGKCSDEQASRLLNEVSSKHQIPRKKKSIAEAYKDCIGVDAPEDLGDTYRLFTGSDSTRAVLERIHLCGPFSAEDCHAQAGVSGLEPGEAGGRSSTILIPGQLEGVPSPFFEVTVPEDKRESIALGEGHIWEGTHDRKTIIRYNEAYKKQAQDKAVDIKIDAGEITELTEVEVQEKASDWYRAGGCGPLSFEQCFNRFNVDYAHEALVRLVDANNGDGKNIPKELATVPAGNLMETSCVSMPSAECAATNGKEEGSSLPNADAAPKIEGAEKPDSDEPKPADSSAESSSSEAPESSEKKEEPQASESSDSSDSSQSSSSTASASASTSAAAGAEPSPSSTTSVSASAAAGDETRPTDGDSGDADAADGENYGAAGDASRPSTSSTAESSESSSTSTSAEQAGQESSPKSSESEAKSQDGNSDKAKDAGGKPVDGVAPVTMAAVAGGGIAGQRENDFGTLTGSVVSLCVPGDIVCSLPENSELATSLVKIGENMTLGEGGLVNTAKSLAAGDTRMAGLLAVQAVDTLANISGLPPTKLSPETFEMLIALATGGAMVAMGDPTGAGAAILATTIPQIGTALPEIFAQLQDIPAIIEALPKAGETAARNLGLEKVSAKLAEGFNGAGMTDISNLANIPNAVMEASAALLEDNSGLMELATNPEYLNAGAHGEPGFRSINISDKENGIVWTQSWMDAIRKTMA